MSWRAGARIAIIPWATDRGQFVAAAPSPAQGLQVTIGEGQLTATVVVGERQLSLAIGREGQNARLAARLTGWRIDIKSEAAAAEAGLWVPPTPVEDGVEPAEEPTAKSSEPESKPTEAEPEATALEAKPTPVEAEPTALEATSTPVEAEPRALDATPTDLDAETPALEAKAKSKRKVKAAPSGDAA